MNWMPIAGKFESTEEKIKFIGGIDENNKENKQLPRFGQINSDINFAEGSISFNVKFIANSDKMCLLGIVINKSINNDQEEFDQFSICNQPFMFEMKEYKNKKWNFKALNGSGENFKINEEFNRI